MEHKPRVNPVELQRGNMSIELQDGTTVTLKDYKIQISTQPPKIFANRNIDFYTFKGRTGYLAIDNLSNDPIDYEIEISSFAKTMEERFNQEVFFESLKGRELKLRFYHQPYGYYVAYFTGLSSQGNRMLGYMETGKMQFKLQPEMRLSNEIITLSSGDKITYPYGKLNGVFELTGTGSIGINDGKMTTWLKDVSSQYPIFIDPLLKRTYSFPQYLSYMNRSNLKVDSTYPTIYNGMIITWTGDVTSLKLHLDWRL